ncbi:hypothetical protein Acr_00g0047670 [Actinidia rufa]|uniref:Uncharacterized protein n=1 Tax=Actinidia rufa TaxID=165716 RepID=A0A7J0DK10_9ERIC|nr:hypothetical protein Acr_00g0047670 [Actinidia rufa]
MSVTVQMPAPSHRRDREDGDPFLDSRTRNHIFSCGYICLVAEKTGESGVIK